MRRQRFWLCLPTLPVIVMDYAVTLWGQPAAYWAGDFTKAHEGQELLAFFLRWHPLAFIGWACAWILATSLLLLFTPRFVAFTISFFLILQHTWGLWTWLIGFPGSGHLMALMQLTEALLLSLAWSKVRNS